MRYRKLTEIEKLELKDRHQGKQDRRICDRIKEVLLLTTGYNVIEISDILLLSHEGIRKHLIDYQNDHKLKPRNGGSYSKLAGTQEEELINHLEINNYVYARDIGLYIER